MTEPAPPDLDRRRFQRGDGDRVRERNELAMATTPASVADVPDEDLDDVRSHYLDGDGEFLVAVLDDTIVATGGLTTPSEWKGDP